MTYFNTTHETGTELKTFNQKAKTQNERVLEYFKPNRKLSASLIVNLFENVPITSIRRALNTLENKGLINKTGIQITGIYGRKENLYKLI